MDNDQGLGLGQDNISSTNAVNTQQSVPAVSENIQPERTFKQSELNEIVGRARREERSKYSAPEPSYQNQGHYESSAPQYKHSSEQDIRKYAAEEAQRLRDEWISDAQSKSETEQAQNIVQKFWNKAALGKEKYQDFDQVTSDIEYASFPNVVQILAENIENAHDVLYELGKDRLKMAQLETLSRMSPKDALVQARRLADSIKENQETSRMRQPNAPLSQLRPSNSGTDNGVLSVSDYRKRYKV